jgi:hypothetical protein
MFDWAHDDDSEANALTTSASPAAFDPGPSFGATCFFIPGDEGVGPGGVPMETCCLRCVPFPLHPCDIILMEAMRRSRREKVFIVVLDCCGSGNNAAINYCMRFMVGGCIS